MSKLALRRAWFQVHKWIGLLLAILIIPLSLSGSALVFKDTLDRWLHPARYAVAGTALRPLNDYAMAATAVLAKGDRIASLALPDGRGPVVVAASPARPPVRPGPPQRTNIYLDPPTGRVLAVASSAGGAVRVLHMLHGSLLVPGAGRSIVGWLGVAMMLSAATGLWLWWPTVGRWSRGLRWRRKPGDVNTNLHHLLGFWVALPLFVLSLTGAWIAFPAFFGALVGEGGRGEGRRAPPAAPMLAPAQPLATVAARALAVTPGTVRMISWPTVRSPDWTVAVAPARGEPSSVKVSDDTGAATAAPARRQGGVARWMRRIHDGDDMGPVWRTLIFVGGIIPAVLAVTGIVMWWNQRRWRRALAQRRRGVA